MSLSKICDGPQTVQHHTFIDPLASERDPGKGPPPPQPIFLPKSSFAPLSMVHATKPILAPCGWGNVWLLLGEEGCGMDLDFSQKFRCAQFGGFMLEMFTSNPLGDSQTISSLSPVLFGASVQSEASDL